MSTKYWLPPLQHDRLTEDWAPRTSPCGWINEQRIQVIEDCFICDETFIQKSLWNKSFLFSVRWDWFCDQHWAELTSEERVTTEMDHFEGHGVYIVLVQLCPLIAQA